MVNMAPAIPQSLVPGFVQFPSKTGDRCPICGLKRETLRLYLPVWEKHPVHPVRVLNLKSHPTAKRSLTLYNGEDLLNLLNYEAEQQGSKKISPDS